MKKFLVTGSTGFIGRHVVKALQHHGHQVIEASNQVGIDLTDQTQVGALPDVDVVIHLAGINTPLMFVKKSHHVTRTNLLATQYLLDRYCGKIQRFILASTCESQAGAMDYFDTPLPIDENIPVSIADIQDPRSCYGGSKLANELQVMSAHHEHNLPYTIIRYSNVYGPGQKNQFIPDFINRAKNGDLTLFGGDSTRNFMYIDDAAEATVKVAESASCKNQIVNLGSNLTYSIQQVAQVIINQLGITDQLILNPGPCRYRQSNMDKLHQLTGFTAEIDLIEGIKRTINS
jgi:nucleoside-diphosphate-sugar epimerase